jgi:hypothetical protein
VPFLCPRMTVLERELMVVEEKSIPQRPIIKYQSCATHEQHIIQTCLIVFECVCKGTSVRFLTSSLLSYSPPVYIYFLSSPLYHLQGLHLQPTTSIPMAQRLPRRRPTESRRLPSPSHRSDLNSTARVADALGQVRVTLRHPPPSCGHPYRRGLVIGGLVL